MPKLPWKRGDANGEPPPLSSYLPTQPVDYTALPIVEDESIGARFRRLGPIARIGVIVFPLLFIGLAVWGMMILTAPGPMKTPLRPEVTLGDVRAVNPNEITVDGTTANVPDGTSVSATLLVDGTAVDWAAAESSVGTVTDNKVSLRLRRSDSWSQALVPEAVYSVELKLASDPPAESRQTLIVPGPIADEFYAAGGTQPDVNVEPTFEPTDEPTIEPTVEPTPAATQTIAPTVEPTLEPTPQPTALPPTPTVEGPPAVAAAANATLLISPTLGSGIISRPAAGVIFQPLLRTPDTQFFLVLVDGQAGWLPAGQASFDPAVAVRIPASTPSPEAVQAGPLRASARNGGNIRFLPNVNTGTVLGQMRANEAVTLKARTANGGWYRVVAPAAEGWVSATLLQIPGSVAAQVPVAGPTDFVPGSGGASAPSAPLPVTQVAATPLPAPPPPSAASSSLTIPSAPGVALLIAPVAGSDVVSRPVAGTLLRALLRTVDSTFVLVLEGKRTGWIEQPVLGLTQAQIRQVPLVIPTKQAVEAGPLRATVGTDGNVRIGPLPDATILGVAHQGERLTLKARTKDGQWYRVVAPAAEGWLSVIALGIEPGVAETVPVAE